MRALEVMAPSPAGRRTRWPGDRCASPGPTHRRCGRLVAVLALTGLLAAGTAACSPAGGGAAGTRGTRGAGASGTGSSGTGSSGTPAAGILARQQDPETDAALLRIATTFNDDYSANEDAAVYDRWDAASRAVITRATYLRRHRQCPNPPEGKVDTWGVTRGPGGAWLVHYSIGGQQLVDYWYFVDGRFVFDLPKSNPNAVALYRASTAQYAKDVGCDR